MEIKAAILRYCKYQERCHMEVRNKLYTLGLGKNEVEEQISILIESGVLNEERFAKAYAGGKFRMKRWGREKIIQQLRLRKVSEYCINKAMKEIDTGEYDEMMIKLAQKKFDEVKGDRSIQSRKSKIYRYLIQKGYEHERIINIVNELHKKVSK